MIIIVCGVVKQNKDILNNFLIFLFSNVLQDNCCSSFKIHVIDNSNPDMPLHYLISRHGGASDFDEMNFKFECPAVNFNRYFVIIKRNETTTKIWFFC